MHMTRNHLCALALLMAAGSLAGTAAAQAQAASTGALRLVAATVAAEPAAREEMAERRKSAAELRAEALLAKAVRHVQVNGRAGAEAFSRGPEFVDRDLYAFALGTDGILLGSGGWSVSLVGQNVLDELDAQGRPFFRRMLEQALAHGGGQVHYDWYNPVNAESTRKTTNFVRVDDVVVAVGFYTDRASPTDAKRLLREAVAALRSGRAEALAAFQNEAGPFVKNELYVFVVDTTDGRFVAHGASPALVGTDAYELLDSDRRFIVREMARIAAGDGEGALDYLWTNPMTGRIESKHTVFVLEGGLLVGVGSYHP